MKTQISELRYFENLLRPIFKLISLSLDFSRRDKGHDDIIGFIIFYSILANDYNSYNISFKLLRGDSASFGMIGTWNYWELEVSMHLWNEANIDSYIHIIDQIFRNIIIFINEDNRNR